MGLNNSRRVLTIKIDFRHKKAHKSNNDSGFSSTTFFAYRIQSHAIKIQGCNMGKLRKILSANLSRYMIANDLTYEKFGDVIKSTKQWAHSLSNDAENISLNTLDDLAMSLKTTPSNLLSINYDLKSKKRRFRPTRIVLSENLVSWKMSKGISYAEVGEMIGRDRSYTRRIIANSLNHSLDLVEEIHTALRLDLSAMLED